MIPEQRTAGTRSRQLWIPSGRHELEAELEIPADATRLVIIAHGGGHGCHSTCNQYVGQVLRERGMATLLADLMTRGEAMDIITRRSVPFDVELIAERLRDVTRWVSTQTETAEMVLGYFGDFTGSAAVLIGASADPTPVRSVVCRGGRPDLAGERLALVRVPTLIIVGTGDAELWAHNEDAFHQLRCEKKLEVIAGATHRIEAEGGLDAVAQRAADWFDRTL